MPFSPAAQPQGWLRLPPPSGSGDVPADVDTSDPNATQEAQQLLAMFKSLPDLSSNRCLSGTMYAGANSTTITTGDNILAYYETQVPSKYPSILGVEIDNYGHNYTSSGLKAKLISRWEGGHIPMFAAHAQNPIEGAPTTSPAKYEYDASTSVDFNDLTDPSHTTYQRWFENTVSAWIDFLLELQSEGVACIFRPFHEMNLADFWWSANMEPSIRPASGGDVGLFKLAWQQLVSEMRTQGVHNVLWMYHVQADNGAGMSGNGREYCYPGSGYVDLVSASIYNTGPSWVTNGKVTNARQLFDALPDHPACLGEIGPQSGGSYNMGTTVLSPLKTSGQLDDVVLWMEWWQNRTFSELTGVNTIGTDAITANVDKNTGAEFDHPAA